MTMTSNNPWKVTKVFENNGPETYQVDLGKFGSCNAIVAQDLSFETATLIAVSPDLLNMLKDGAFQLGRLSGQDLEAYARTFSALSEVLISKAEGI